MHDTEYITHSANTNYFACPLRVVVRLELTRASDNHFGFHSFHMLHTVCESVPVDPMNESIVWP